MLKKNDVITAKIQDMHRLGSGVAKYEDKTVFVPGTCVGDVCEILILKIKPGYCYGKCLKIIKPGISRIIPACPVGGQCGGCDFQHITYEEEKRIKTSTVSRDFNIRQKLDCPVLPVLSCEKESGYRNKAVFPLKAGADGKAVMGFYAKNSHRVVPSDFCLLQQNIINEIARYTLKLINRYNIPPYDEHSGKGVIRHIFIRSGSNGDQVMLCLVCATPDNPAIRKVCLDAAERFKKIKCAVINVNDENTNVILGKKNINVLGDGKIKDHLLGLTFNISPESFYQVNHDGAEMIYTIAENFLKLSKEDVLLDLYCGAGTIGISMASKVSRVVGVEIVSQAVNNAIENAKVNDIDNATFICRDAGKAAAQLARQGFLPTAVVVDPPRKGCGKETLDAIISMSPGRIAMISCNSFTAARDCRYLVDNGYKLEKVQPFDMFPRTRHVEAVCLLTKDA